MPLAWQKKLEKFEWAEFYANPHSELCLNIQAARYPEKERALFLEEHLGNIQFMQPAILRLRAQTPLVRAQQLIAEGIPPGKRMGLLLKEGERISVNDGIENPAEIISRLKKTPLWPK